ncbi:MAG: hypothetical protein ACI9JM_002848 [Halioglobus sp.]|jgi:hypothetical protein
MVRHTGEDFINVEGVAEASVLSFQPPGIQRTELDAPKANRFAANTNAPFGLEIFDEMVGHTGGGSN